MTWEDNIKCTLEINGLALEEAKKLIVQKYGTCVYNSATHGSITCYPERDVVVKISIKNEDIPEF